MLGFEMELWQDGVLSVAGLDEAGRGALCGAVVAAAVVLKPEAALDGVQDSKALSAKARDECFDLILQRAADVGIGCASPGLVDRINVRQASRIAMIRALDRLSVSPGHLLVDAEYLPVAIPQWAIVKGDACCLSIAAASIVAKVVRDRLCQVWDRCFPGYGIAQNKGYATREHFQALARLGPSPIHRRSFLKRFATEQVHLDLAFGEDEAGRAPGA